MLSYKCFCFLSIGIHSFRVDVLKGPLAEPDLSLIKRTGSRKSSQLDVESRIPYRLRVNDTYVLACTDNHAAGADLVDHTGCAVCGVEDGFYCIIIKDGLPASGTFQFFL